MSTSTEAIKQSIQLWLASVFRGLLVAAATWLSSHYPQAATILNIPETAFPWIATFLSVSLISGMSVWLANKRQTAIMQGAVGQSIREGVNAAELVTNPRDGGSK